MRPSRAGLQRVYVGSAHYQDRHRGFSCSCALADAATRRKRPLTAKEELAELEKQVRACE